MSGPIGPGGTAGTAATDDGPARWDPVMRSPIHRHHVALGATFARQGDWETPATYPDPAGEAHALAEGVGVCDITARGKVDLRGDVAPLLTRIARTSEGWQPGELVSVEPAPSETHPGVLAPISDGWVLLFCPPASLGTRLEEMEAPTVRGTVMVTDVSSHYAGLALAGPRTFDLLARLTGFDLRNLPPGSCASTRAIEVGAILLHRDAGASVVELWFGSEYGRYAWETVLEAGHALGAAAVGHDALASLGWW